MKVLIIVPCYNEQDNIEQLYLEIRKKTPYDIIVLNDGSIDSSDYILRRLKITHLDLLLNLGIGGAVQAGYRYAMRNGYAIAVQLDGDGQHDPDMIDKLISPIINGDADLAIGSRFIEKSGFQSTAMRRVGIRLFTGLLFLLSGKRITDATSGFRAANLKAMRLFNTSYARDYPEPESIMCALKNKLRVIEIPVVMRERQRGVSSISPWKSLYYMLKVSLGILLNAIQPRILK